MIYIVCAHPYALHRAYPLLQELRRERKVRILSFTNFHSALCGTRDAQVVMVHPRAIMHTQVVRPSDISDFGYAYAQLCARTKYIVIIKSLPPRSVENKNEHT